MERVNPDTVVYTQRLVAGVEQRMILGGMRKLMDAEL